MKFKQQEEEILFSQPLRELEATGNLNLKIYNFHICVATEHQFLLLFLVATCLVIPTTGSFARSNI